MSGRSRSPDAGRAAARSWVPSRSAWPIRTRTPSRCSTSSPGWPVRSRGRRRRRLAGVPSRAPPRADARPPAAPARPPAPFALAFYDHVLRLDAEGAWWFEALWTRERDRELRTRLAEPRARGAALRPFRTARWRSVPGTRAWPGRGRLPRTHPRRRSLPGQPHPAPRVGARGRPPRPLGDRRRGARPRPSRLPRRAVGRAGQSLARALSCPARPPGAHRAHQGERPLDARAELERQREGPGGARDDRRPRPQRP